MNLQLRVVIRQLGLLILVLSALVSAVALFAVFDRLTRASASTGDLRAMGMTALVGLIGGGSLYIGGRRQTGVFGQREALLLVAASWLVGAALAALPYRFWSAMRPDSAMTAHPFDSYVDCYFEAMSGLTTTGATVVQAVTALPRSLLLWRALTHWLGGLGIVVLFVAVLPMLGVGSRRVFRIEAPGPSPEGVRPRIQDTARILWLIYLALTVAETLALRLCGMGWFDAVCHTFATLATGGFSTHHASIAAYPSVALQLVIVVFMVLAGVNFGLYHRLLQRQWQAVRTDPELRVYLAILAIGTVIVTVSLWPHSSGLASSTSEPPTWGSAVRHALFQVVSIQTTTGFCSADSDQWSFAAKVTLLLLMFIGASAGSTGGGIKVVRIMVAAKVVLAEIEHVYRPKVIRPVKIGKTVIEPEMKLNTLVYIVGTLLLFAIGTILLMLLEAGRGVDITTAATASAATLNNIGPGFARVGATQNYGWFTASSKVVMSMLMLLGRLEMFTIVVLLTPRFWKTE